MPNHWCWISWSWPTTPSRTNTQKRCPFHHRGLKCKSRKSKDQIRSVTQSCPTLCDPMNHSMPGLPVHHQLLEFTQTHVRRVSDAIQPSHPLSSPSPPAPNPSSIRVFSNESTLRMRWPKYWSFSFSIIPSKQIPRLISFRMDWLYTFFTKTLIFQNDFLLPNLWSRWSKDKC